MLTIEFGFHPCLLELNADLVTTQPLADHGETVKSVLASPNIDKDWIYAPASGTRDFMSGAVRKHPYSARVFGLPKTHLLTHKTATDTDHLEFVLWCLSFFTGQRLTATDAGFLDSTPTKPGKLVDFVPTQNTLAKSIDLADKFWSASSGDRNQPKRFAAAIHALFMAQNPQFLQFERFLYLYTALDACYKLASTAHPPSSHVSHADRTAWMCKEFSMNVPSWADRSGSGSVEVAVIRNDAFHEALYMGEPLGFALNGIGSYQNLALEMAALVCRLLVSLIGGSSADYIRSPVNTRQTHGLKL